MKGMFSCYRDNYTFFVMHLHSEFDKNANSIYVSVAIPISHKVGLATDRGLRFLCVDFG